MHATNVLAVDLSRENEALRARVAMLEARLTEITPATVTIGAYTVDLRSGWYWLDGQPVGHLTRTELRLLAVLAQAPGRAVSYAQIGVVVWPGVNAGSLEFDNLLRVNLSRLRGKLDRSAIVRTLNTTGSLHFRTSRGYGVGLVP